MLVAWLSMALFGVLFLLVLLGFLDLTEHHLDLYFHSTWVNAFLLYSSLTAPTFS